MENRWEIAMPKHNGLRLLNPCGRDETFVKIEGTNRFFVSTHGQVAMKKKDGKFRMLKPEFNRCRIGFIGERKYRTVFIDNIVAKAFLVNVPGRNCIWHKDRNRYNNEYRNLIYVTKDDYIALFRKEIRVKDLPYIQYYYPIWAFNPRFQKQKYIDMMERCKKRNYGTVCEAWSKDMQFFCKWMEKSSYPDVGYAYEIDKDILCPGNKTYSPENCCLVPHFINLAYKKPRKYLKKTDDGVGRYYFIVPGTTNNVLIFETKEEAYCEYVRRKAGFMRKQAVKNRYAVTNKIYHAMIDYANSLDAILKFDEK